MIKIFFDGACEPINPGGTASYGWIIKKADKVVAQDAGIIGEGAGMTNNIAEYTALIEALKFILKSNNREKLKISGDSKLVCNMVAKEWGWNKKKSRWEPHKESPHLKILLEESLYLLRGLDYEIGWVPREENFEADELARRPLVELGIISPE